MILSGLGEYDPHKLFGWLLSIERRNGSLNGAKAFIRLMIRFLQSLVLRRQYLRCLFGTKAPQIVFCISEANIRKDLRDMILNVADTIEKKHAEVIYANTINTFSFKRLIENLRCMGDWYRNLSGVYTTKIEALLLITYLFICKDYLHYLQHIIQEHNVRMIVVRYDAFYLDNFIVQFARNNKIVSATLQHGVMVARRESLSHRVDFSGLEFKFFTSDYFLAWNTFTKREAVKNGVDEEKVCVLGNAKCLSVKAFPYSNTGVFGVILDGKDTSENNEKMVNVANSISKKINMKYRLRYHPAFRGDEYKCITNEYAIVDDICISSIEEFLKEHEFCIVSNSTLLFEIPYYGRMYYRFSEKKTDDKYIDLDEPSFYDVESFANLYTSCSLNQTVCSSKQDREKYRDFFYHFIK